MDKKVIIAIILSMAVLFLYPYIINRVYPPQLQEKAAPAKPSAQAPVPSPGTQTSQASLKKGKPAAPPVKEELTTVETPLFKAVFTNIGGGIRSWELKKYRQTLDKTSKTENLAENIGKDESFKTHISTGSKVENIVFKPSKPSLNISDKETSELVYTGASASGLTVEKRFIFSGDNYIIKTDLTVINTGKAPFDGNAETVLEGIEGTAGKGRAGYHVGPILRTKDKLTRLLPKEPKKTGSDKLEWLGIEDKYFLSALIPKTNTPVSWAAEIFSESDSRAALQIPVKLAPGEKTVYAYNSFLGPKEYDRLVKQGSDLEEAIEFGMFAFMAKPLLVVLNFFERYLRNYGIAIIVLTVIIKAIFYPLTKHSLKSMREMQKIQPQLTAIKEKYKDNKEKLNREMMDLYKRYKINPLSGCLPMILQIPVFIALYEVLYVAIELRHAPFFLWLKDLSDKDPYYISPIVMGVTMLIQQKMTPTMGDPAQAKIMLIMPVVFTFMFLNFPAGLVIYWLVNNVLTIAQQYYIQRVPAKA